MITQKYPNLWLRPDEDPRFEGLLHIANVIQDGLDLAAGDREVAVASEFEPEVYPYASPLRLARLMREAADRIEAKTEASLPD